jgi:hypothetical protein
MKIPTSLVVGLQSLSLSILVGYVPVVGGNPLPQKGVKEPVSEATRSLHQGTVKGFTDSHGNSVFLGIPFAETTGGKNRYVSNAIRCDSLLLTK